MPRVVDRSPASQERALGKILAETGTGQNGYGGYGGYGGARRPAPGQGLFGRILTGAARGLVSVPIGPDAGLSSYALRGFGIGVLGAKEDRDKLQAVRVADERYERGELRKDAKLALDYQETQQESMESARDEHYSQEVNAMQVQDALEDGRIDAPTAEKLSGLVRQGGVKPGQLGVLLGRIGDDADEGSIFDKIEQRRSTTALTRIAGKMASHEASRGFTEDFMGNPIAMTPGQEVVWNNQLKVMKDVYEAEVRKADRNNALKGLHRKNGQPEHVREVPERWAMYMGLAFNLLKERSGGIVPQQEETLNLATEWALDGGWAVVDPSQNPLGLVR